MGRAARTVAGATLGLTLVLGGCGDDTEPEDERHSFAPTTPSDSRDVADRAPADAYVDWVEALVRQDAATACALQAPEFTIALRYEAILVDRAELGDPCVGFEALLWEDPAFTGELVDVAVTHETEEDAVLEVHLVEGAQTVTMTYHRAAWRVLATEERAEGEAAGWVAAWCRLDPSMSRDEIVALMGEPSGEYTVSDGGEPQLWWAQDQYDFRAYLDVDGSVLELVGDYDALSEEDRTVLTCPELRS